MSSLENGCHRAGSTLAAEHSSSSSSSAWLSLSLSSLIKQRPFPTHCLLHHQSGRFFLFFWTFANRGGDRRILARSGIFFFHIFFFLKKKRITNCNLHLIFIIRLQGVHGVLGDGYLVLAFIFPQISVGVWKGGGGCPQDFDCTGQSDVCTEDVRQNGGVFIFLYTLPCFPMMTNTKQIPRLPHHLD